MTPDERTKREATLREQREAYLARGLVLTETIENASAKYRPNEEHPDGQKMPDSDWAAFNLAAQQLEIVTTQVKGFDLELKQIARENDAVKATGLEIGPAFLAYALHGSDQFPNQRPMTPEEKDAFTGVAPQGSMYDGTSCFKLANTFTRTDGATAIPEDHPEGVLVENMKSFGGVANMVSVYRTAHGRNVPVPNADTTSQVGERIAEDTSASDLDMPATGDTTLRDWIYSSRVSALSHQVVRDASFNVLQWANGSLVTRIARKLESELTTGTGADRPTGFMNNVTEGVTTAAAGSYEWSELLDLYGSVDDAYLIGSPGHGIGTGGKIGYAMNKTTMVSLMQLADLQKRPLFVPDLHGMGQLQLFGFPIFKVYGMADIADDAHPIVFGNFGYYILRAIGDTLMLRFDDSVYGKKGTTGFMAFSEADGRWVQKLDANSKVSCVKSLKIKDS